MIIEVLPVKDCSDCVFCEEAVFCALKDGEPVDFDYDNGRCVASFCPLINPTEKVTDRVKVLKPNS